MRDETAPRPAETEPNPVCERLGFPGCAVRVEHIHVTNPWPEKPGRAYAVHAPPAPTNCGYTNCGHGESCDPAPAPAETCPCGHEKNEHHADGICAGDDRNGKENCRCASYSLPYPAPSGGRTRELRTVTEFENWLWDFRKDGPDDYSDGGPERFIENYKAALAEIAALRERVRALEAQAQKEAWELLDKAEADRDRLAAIIEKAPHHLSCNVAMSAGLNMCDCWKAAALAGSGGGEK